MREKLRRLFPLRWQDNVMLVVVMAAALDFSMLLQTIGADESHAALIFVLGVLVISCSTDGYFYGSLASLFAVVIVNYVFLPPYYRFSLDATGYPLTFVTMFSVSIVTSTLASHVRDQEAAQAEAERERLRSNLLRAVGHDLRTPLTSIIGSAETILSSHDQLDREECITLLRNICRESEWMIHMVENLLSITKVGGDARSIRKQPVAPEEIISEVLEKFQKHYQTPVEVKVPSDWLEVPMDAMLIEQVLYNLMENAVLHGRAGTVFLVAEREKRWARFTVSDDGCGIPEEKLDHLFHDYMERADTSSGDKKHDMGVGLMVCRDIIKVHGGDLGVRNRPEGGAEFYFLLPMEEERYGSHQGQGHGHRGREEHQLPDRHRAHRKRL